MLVKDLCPDPSNAQEKLLKGCGVFVPETAFFKEARVDFLTTMDRDGCLAIDTKAKIEDLLALRTKLSDLVRERRKESVGKEQMLKLRREQDLAIDKQTTSAAVGRRFGKEKQKSKSKFVDFCSFDRVVETAQSACRAVEVQASFGPGAGLGHRPAILLEERIR